MRDVWLLINDFEGLNYVAPLVIAGKLKKIPFSVHIILEDFMWNDRNVFRNSGDELMALPFFEGLDVSIYQTRNDFVRSFETFDGVLVARSMSIIRLRERVCHNHACRYVLLSYFNDKFVELNRRKADLIFVSNGTDLKHVSGPHVRIGLPYWDLFLRKKEYDFSHLAVCDLPDGYKKVLLPEIHSCPDWHARAAEWVDAHYDPDILYVFKHRVKGSIRKDKNDTFECVMKKYSNVRHVYSPYFFTNQALLYSVDEVVFLSTRTCYVYECARAGVRCVRGYQQPDDSYFHLDPMLVDRYIANPDAVISDLFPPDEEFTPFCWAEIQKLAQVYGVQPYNDMRAMVTVSIKDIDFSAYNFLKGRHTDRQIFVSLDKTSVVKTWVRDYEWASFVRKGFESNYYDSRIVPHFKAFIDDATGVARGYVTHYIPEEQHLRTIVKRRENIFSPSTWKRILLGKVSIKRVIKPLYVLRVDFLLRLLYVLFSRAEVSRCIFVELNINNLWLDEEGYYLFDLEQCKSFDWFFNTDVNNTEHERQVAYRHLFNQRLQDLIEKHGLIFPMRINTEIDFSLFWKMFVEENDLKGVPRELSLRAYI